MVSNADAPLHDRRSTDKEEVQRIGETQHLLAHRLAFLVAHEIVKRVDTNRIR